MPKDEINIELAEHLNKLTGQMQSGVAFLEQADWERSGVPRVVSTELKHLRVGVNSAKTETAAIAQLLIAAGIFTGDDYIRACISQMEQEVLRCQDLLNKRYPGANIRLGEAGSMP